MERTEHSSDFFDLWPSRFESSADEPVMPAVVLQLLQEIHGKKGDLFTIERISHS
jgi:hypothetical protein